MTERLPVAVVGVGRMGRHHARHYAEMEGADLVAVVDGDAGRARAAAAEYGGAAFASVAELLARGPAVRAVSVATPTGAHRACAEELLPRGIACLIEKPLAPTGADARAIASLAAEHGTVVQVGHTERFNPVVRKAVELGVRPRFIEADRVAPMTFRSIDVGVVADLMIHDIDVALMLAGCAVAEVSAVGVSVLGAHEDVANARLVFEDGCVANLTASRLGRKTERKLRVFGDAVYLSLDYARREGVAVRVDPAALAAARARLAAGESPADLDPGTLLSQEPLPAQDEDPLRSELEHFLAAARGARAPAVDASAGCAAVEVAERVVAAIRARPEGGA